MNEKSSPYEKDKLTLQSALHRNCRVVVGPGIAGKVWWLCAQIHRAQHSPSNAHQAWQIEVPTYFLDIPILLPQEKSAKKTGCYTATSATLAWFQVKGLASGFPISSAITLERLTLKAKGDWHTRVLSIFGSFQWQVLRSVLWTLQFTALGMDYRGMPVIHMETRRKKYAMKLPLDAQPVKLFLAVVFSIGCSSSALGCSSRCTAFRRVGSSILALRMERTPYCSGPWRWSPTRVMSLRISVASAYSESSGVYWSVAWDNDILRYLIELGFSDLCAPAGGRVFGSKWHAMTMSASWVLVASRFFKATNLWSGDCYIVCSRQQNWLTPQVRISHSVSPKPNLKASALTKARGSCGKFGWKSPGIVGGADLIMIDFRGEVALA